MYLIKMRIAARYTLSQDLSYTDVAHRYIPTIQRPWRILMTHQTYNPTAILPARIVIIVKISTIISPRLLKWTSEKSRHGCVNIIWFRNGWPTFRAWKFWYHDWPEKKWLWISCESTRWFDAKERLIEVK